MPPEAKVPDPSAPLQFGARHAFWNVSDAAYRSLTPARDGAFIAGRALSTSDPGLLAYAIWTVAPAQWLQAARVRGISPGTRELVRSIARYGPRRAT